MSILAVEQRYGSLSTAAFPGGYDQTKLNLGSLMVQKNGSASVDKYCGPMPVGLARPMETANGAIPSIFPWCMQWSSTIDWVFLVDAATATTNRRISHYAYDRTTSLFVWKGYITVPMVGAGNHTVRGFRMSYDTYSTGTVSCAGGTTAVTGAGGTAWQTSRLAVGSRIGFNTVDPASVTTWYEIVNIGGDGALTLATDGPVLSGATYVIEDLRAVIQTTSNSANNGNLIVVKGLRPEIFMASGSIVNNGASASAPTPSATAANHVSNGYWVIITSNASHWMCTGQTVTLAGWTWTGTNSGSVNGTWTILFTPDATHYAVAPTSGPCPTSGSIPSVIGTAVSGGAIPDNIRAGYWIADASSSLNQTAIGVGIMPKDSWTQQYCWGLDCTGTTFTLYKYNLRAALTLTLGKDTANGFVLKTNTYSVTTTAPSNSNNGRYAVASHQATYGSGIGCLYFTDLTKLYRTKDVTTITAADAAYVAADAPVEFPPGTGALGSTFAAGNLMGSIEYCSMIDKFIVLQSVATSPFRSYITEYKSDGTAFDRVFLSDIRQIDQSLSDFAGIHPSPSYLSRLFACDCVGGLLYVCGGSMAAVPTAANNFMYTLPIGADWEYASSTDQRIVGPVISTPNCSSFVRAYVSTSSVLGAKSGNNLGTTPEPMRVYYRTTNFNTTSTSWALLGDDGDLSSVTATSSIQFMFEFRTIGVTCLPSRLMSMTVLYNDYGTDSHFQPSVGLSDLTTKKFAWRLSTEFGRTIPTLYMRLYDAALGTNLMTALGYNFDTPSLAHGTWEKSTDGTSWNAWDTTDKGNETTYLRYTAPAGIAEGVSARAFLSLA